MNLQTSRPSSHWLLWAMFFCIGIFPFVPTSPDLRTILLPIVIGLIVMLSISRIVQDGRVGWRYGYILGFLFFLCTINLLAAVISGISISAFFRGLAPFLFLITYESFRESLGSGFENRRDFPAKCILFAATTWCIFILAKNYDIMPDLLSGSILRLTYLEPDMLVPFGLVGGILAVYGFGFSFAPRGVLVVLFLLMIIVSGYRSQLALIVAVILFRYRNFLSLRSLIGLAMSVIALAVLAITYWSIFEIVLQRFIFSSGDTVRNAEIQFASSQFAQSPIFGKGLGNPIPVSITRELNWANTFENGTVAYIHNASFYFLMNTGLVGVFLLAIAVIPSPKFMIATLLEGKDTLAEALVVTYLSLVVYFHISASFRQIQMILLLTFLVASIDVISRQDRQAK